MTPDDVLGPRFTNQDWKELLMILGYDTDGELHKP